MTWVVVAVAAPGPLGSIHVGSIITQLVIAAVTSGLLVSLLRLGPDRKKLGAEAGVSSATAADLLTGRALAMLEAADRRAKSADERAEKAEQKASESDAKADRAAEQVRQLRARVDFLVEFIRKSGLDVPPWPEGADRLRTRRGDEDLRT